MKWIAGSVVLILLLTACRTAEERRDIADGFTQSWIPTGTIVERDIIRFVDTEAGVVCWASKRGRSGGISCLPLGETALRQGSER